MGELKCYACELGLGPAEDRSSGYYYCPHCGWPAGRIEWRPDDLQNDDEGSAYLPLPSRKGAALPLRVRNPYRGPVHYALSVHDAPEWAVLLSPGGTMPVRYLQGTVPAGADSHLLGYLRIEAPPPEGAARGFPLWVHSQDHSIRAKGDVWNLGEFRQGLYDADAVRIPPAEMLAPGPREALGRGAPYRPAWVRSLRTGPSHDEPERRVATRRWWSVPVRLVESASLAVDREALILTPELPNSWLRVRNTGIADVYVTASVRDDENGARFELGWIPSGMGRETPTPGERRIARDDAARLVLSSAGVAPGRYTLRLEKDLGMEAERPTEIPIFVLPPAREERDLPACSVGIDFGTSKCAAFFMVTGENALRPVLWERDPSRDRPGRELLVPPRLEWLSRGDPNFGYHASERSVVDASGSQVSLVVESVKSHLRHGAPGELLPPVREFLSLASEDPNRPALAEALKGWPCERVAEFILGELIEQTTMAMTRGGEGTEFGGGATPLSPDTALCISHPVVQSAGEKQYAEWLLAAARSLKREGAIELVAEPECAAIDLVSSLRELVPDDYRALISKSRGRDPVIVMVVDSGAGTTDAAYLRLDFAGGESVLEVIENGRFMSEFAGNLVDYALARYLVEEYFSSRRAANPPAAPPYGGHAPAADGGVWWNWVVPRIDDQGRTVAFEDDRDARHAFAQVQAAVRYQKEVEWRPEQERTLAYTFHGERVTMDERAISEVIASQARAMIRVSHAAHFAPPESGPASLWELHRAVLRSLSQGEGHEALNLDYIILSGGNSLLPELTQVLAESFFEGLPKEQWGRRILIPRDVRTLRCQVARGAARRATFHIRDRAPFALVLQLGAMRPGGEPRILEVEAFAAGAPQGARFFVGNDREGWTRPDGGETGSAGSHFRVESGGEHRWEARVLAALPEGGRVDLTPEPVTLRHDQGVGKLGVLLLCEKTEEGRVAVCVELSVVREADEARSLSDEDRTVRTSHVVCELW